MHEGEEMSMTYFEEEDIIHIVISEEPEAASVEIGPNITVELNPAGEVIGVEILQASAFLRDTILDTVQWRILQGYDSETLPFIPSGGDQTRDHKPLVLSG